MENNSEDVHLLNPPELDQNDVQTECVTVPVNENNNRTSKYVWLTIGGCLNSIVHMLIGANVFVALWFAFNSTPISSFQLHIGLSVIGYQLLISHAILSLNVQNGWSAQLSLLHRVRAHVVLQVLGSALAIAGSIVMMKEKTDHFTSLHGKFALAALIFTGISLINGTVSLFSIGRSISVKIAKTNHVLCGIASYTLSSVCLSFGYYKNSFKKWSTDEVAIIMILITCTYTIIIIIRPCKTFLRKLLSFIKFKTF